MPHSIRVSKKHGLNPSVQQCFYCMKDVAVVLFGRIKGDVEAPRKVCFGSRSEPCEECKGYMEQGVILISMDESKTEDPQNPWRTGGWVVVRDSVIERLVENEALRSQILEKRVAFLPDEAWDFVGLPRGDAGELAGHSGDAERSVT